MALLEGLQTDSDAQFELLVAGLRGRERRAVATALCHFEAMSPTAGKLLALFSNQLGRTRIVGITGPPGAGKSTLVNALIGPIRQRGMSLGILAIDPSSPFSGGALLGDRLRMISAIDEGVFVRSLAAQGYLGGITPSAVRMLDGFDAAGFDIVVIETVGTGQAEIDIAQIADVRIVVCAPGLGDHIQAMKSGLLEIADVLVVNKGDRPGAEATRQQLAGAVSARTDQQERNTPVLITTASTGNGVAALLDTFDSVLQQRSVTNADRRRARARYLIERAAADMVVERARRFDSRAFNRLADDLLAGRIDIASAASVLISG